MNKLLFLFIWGIYFSCDSDSVKLVRKHISNDDISVKWYYYSHITTGSPDIVEVTKKEQNVEIYRATYTISEVSLVGRNIILRVVEPNKEFVDTKKVKNEVFGYKIILDSTGTYEELQTLPRGKRE